MVCLKHYKRRVHIRCHDQSCGNNSESLRSTDLIHVFKAEGGPKSVSASYFMSLTLSSLILVDCKMVNPVVFCFQLYKFTRKTVYPFIASTLKEGRVYYLPNYWSGVFLV